jgi:hypothetical protein
MQNAFQAEVLRERGWSTYWVGKNHNIPVDEFDMGSSKRNWPLARKGGLYTYYPGTLEVPERAGAGTSPVSPTRSSPTSRSPISAPGIILAEGSRFAGHALFLKDRKLHYVYNFLGLKPEQHIESEPLEPGECVLGVEFVKEGHGEHGEPTGTAKLYVNEDVVAEEPLRTVPAHFSLTGEGLSIGRDTGDSVSEQYTPFFPFEGGRIVKVEVSIGEDAYVDLERQLMAALARD